MIFRKRRSPLSAVEASRLKQLLAYSSPYAESQPLEPNPVHPADLRVPDLVPYVWVFAGEPPPEDPTDLTIALSRDAAPIPATNNREGYNGADHFGYWLCGLAEYRRLTAIAANYGVTGGKYFDFGGSTGRIFRHFYFQPGDWEVWSSDFKRTSVDWNIANMPTGIRVFQNSYAPVLPIGDNTFDLITAMSVFTHIDETETSWLMELSRILRPGGLAIVTIHSEDTFLRMPPELRSVIERFSPTLAAQPTLPPGRFVSTFRTDDPYRCNTFHSTDFIRQQWGRYFEVCGFFPRASGAQTAVVLRKT